MLDKLASTITLLAIATSAQAQESVYRVSPVRDGAIIAAGALGSALPYAFASQLIHPRCPCDPNEVNALDRGVIGNNNAFLGSVSDASVALAVAAPPLLDYLELGATTPLWEDLAIYSEVLAVNGALVTLAKYTVQRPLPRVYAGQDPELAGQPGGYRSFYSGHTSIVFSSLTAASVTTTLRHGPSLWPWLITAGYGTSVALERVAAGRHFYTDVIVGAVMGAGVGLAIPLLHRREPAPERSASARAQVQWRLAPVGDGVMWLATWRV